jgi:hypothetical protein
MTTHPLLTQVIRALSRHDQPRMATGFIACTRLARVVIPGQGLLFPTDESEAIDRIAGRHFGLTAARNELRRSIAVIDAFEERDAIESAVSRLRVPYDEVYYYFGLATGLIATAPTCWHVHACLEATTGPHE